MAEPASQPADGPEKVYDEPTGTAPSDPKPDLKALEGGGETSEPKRGHLKSAEDKDPSREDLSEAEETASAPQSQHENQIGQGYTAGGKQKSRFRFSRRQKIIGAGTGLIGGGIIAVILFFLPALRLESYLANVNQRVFGFASSAVSQRVQNLFGRYMINHVLTLERCNNHITNDCRADYTKSGYASGLFNAWRDAKVEQKLIDQYDLKFETHSSPGPGQPRITIRSASTGEVINLTEAQVEKGQFTGGSRVFGNEVNKFLNEKTRWYDLMQRKSVRKYLVRKHGVKFWCFFKCDTKDNLELKALDASTRFKYRFVERFIYPFSGKYGFIMDCIISGGSTDPGGKCSPEELRKRGIDRNTLSDEDVQKVIKQFTDNPSTRLSQIVLQTLLEKIMSEEAAKTTISAIPVAGQIYFAAVVIDMFDQMDNFIQNNGLSKLAADITSRQYLEYYVGMRSANDEMKAGVLPADEVGALVDQFNGPQSAEQSLIYQAYANTSNSGVALLGNKAYAQDSQTSQNPPYLCADGNPIPTGELVCPEKKVNRTFTLEQILSNSLISGLLDQLNTYRCSAHVPITNTCIPGPRIVVHPLLGLINSISNTILGPLVGVALEGLKAVPYMGGIISYLTDKLSEVMLAFFGKVFPLPVQLTSPGREKYDGLWGGGEVAASEFGKGGYTDTGQPYGLGGKLLSPAEQTAVLNNYTAQQQYDYGHSGLPAKITNLQYPNSLANRFIAAMPASFSQLSSQFASMLSHPLGGLSFSQAALADSNLLATSPFGIPRFGYAANDPAFSADPAIYTDEYCNAVDQAWQNSKTEDPVTGIDQYSTTDPCLLERVAVEAASSVFTGDGSLNN